MPLKKHEEEHRSRRPRLPGTVTPEVDAVLSQFNSELSEILGDDLVGLYLHGSLALGDFNPDSSDLDFLVATKGEVLDQQFEQLQAMHSGLLKADSSKWAGELEGIYLPVSDLRKYIPSKKVYPYLERGEALQWKPDDIGWVIQRYVLREHGVKLVGPEPKLLIDPISGEVLTEAIRELLRTWWAPMLQEGKQLEDAHYRSYAVLTMCRIFYTVQEGQVVSKPVAAGWAIEHLPAEWQPLIRRALQYPNDQQVGTLPSTRRFIADTIKTCG